VGADAINKIIQFADGKGMEFWHGVYSPLDD
jgi:hypothetical protein